MRPGLALGAFSGGVAVGMGIAILVSQKSDQRGLVPWRAEDAVQTGSVHKNSARDVESCASKLQGLSLENAALRSQLARARGDQGPSRGPGAQQPERPPPRVGLPYTSGRGDIQIALPSVGESPGLPEPNVVRDCRLTSSEVAHLEAVLEESRGRLQSEVRRLYVEVAGDADRAAELRLMSAISEIRHKSVKDDESEALQRVASELSKGSGAVLPPGPTQTPIEQMYRLLVREGPRVIGELVALLGEDKADCVDSHERFSMATLGFAAGTGKREDGLDARPTSTARPPR